MSCEHAQTTTLLWIYGEADEAHASHVATCAECQAVLATHEAVSGALASVPPLPRSDLGEIGPPVLPANRPWRLMAAAAAVLVALVGWQLAGTSDPAVEDTAVAALAPSQEFRFAADLDADLDALESDLDLFAADLETL